MKPRKNYFYFRDMEMNCKIIDRYCLKIKNKKLRNDSHED